MLLHNLQPDIYFNHLKNKIRKINNIKSLVASCCLAKNSVDKNVGQLKPRLDGDVKADNTVSDKPNTNTYSLYEINSTVMNDEQTVPSEKVSNFNSLDENDKIKYCCLSLLSLFFAGNFTQEGLRLIISHLQNFIDFAIPKSFDRLTNKIDSRPLPYDKVWFCDFCDTIIDLKSCYQRNCHLCVHATK